MAEKAHVDKTFKKRQIDVREDAIFIHKLQKIYYGNGLNIKDKVAVKDLSLSISRGECFGLLGANGAGKTTTLKLVSGLEEATSGTALVHGYNIVKYRAAAQRSMGLCPQFDTLIERMSVRENLIYFARLKGLPEAYVNKRKGWNNMDVSL